MQMDADRVDFLIKSYCRVRLRKIEKYTQYLVSAEGEAMQGRLSAAERRFLQRYSETWTGHMDSEVIDWLPAQYRGLDNIKPDYDVDMVVRPKRTQHVFFQATDDIGGVQIGDEETQVCRGPCQLLPVGTILPYGHWVCARLVGHCAAVTCVFEMRPIPLTRCCLCRWTRVTYSAHPTRAWLAWCHHQSRARLPVEYCCDVLTTTA